MSVTQLILGKFVIEIVHKVKFDRIYIKRVHRKPSKNGILLKLRESWSKLVEDRGYILVRFRSPNLKRVVLPS